MKSYKFENRNEANEFYRDWIAPVIRILTGDTYSYSRSILISVV